VTSKSKIRKDVANYSASEKPYNEKLSIVKLRRDAMR
jgi:hypothetical protein